MENAIVVAQPNNKMQEALAGLQGELSALSYPMYETAIKDFERFVREYAQPGASLAATFSAYMTELKGRGLTASSIKTKRIQLRRFFEWAVRVGMLDHAELLRLREVKAPETQGEKAGHWLSLDQINGLLNAPDLTTLRGRRDRAMLGLLVKVGLRRSEVAELTWGHLRQHEGVWVIQNLKRKHGRVQAYIVVPNSVVEDIFNYAERGADNERVIVSLSATGKRSKSITANAIYRIVEEYAKRLGFGKVSPHDLRRSYARDFAGKAAKKGIPLTQLQLQLGHESIETTQHYVNEMMDFAGIGAIVNE